MMIGIICHQLTGGNANSAELIPHVLSQKTTNSSEAALYIGSGYLKNRVMQAVQDVPLYWIETGKIESSEQAMDIVADIVASIQKIKQIHQINILRIYWGSAVHLALLTSANLTSHVINKIKFMEYDHNTEKYIHLPMPKN